MTIKPSLGDGSGCRRGPPPSQSSAIGRSPVLELRDRESQRRRILPGPRPAELRGAGDMATRWPGPRVRRFVVGVFVIALIATAGGRVSIKAGAGIATAQAATPLRKIAEFELPGPPGKRFDY